MTKEQIREKIYQLIIKISKTIKGNNYPTKQQKREINFFLKQYLKADKPIPPQPKEKEEPKGVWRSYP